MVILYLDGMAVVLKNLQSFSTVHSFELGQDSRSTRWWRTSGILSTTTAHFSAISIDDKNPPALLNGKFEVCYRRYDI